MTLENSWLFPIIESIHVMGLAAFVGTIVLADLYTLRAIPDVGPLAAGAAMFFSDTARYLHNPAFHVKLAILLVALAAHFTLRRRGTRFTAILSLILWSSVVLAARAIADFDV